MTKHQGGPAFPQHRNGVGGQTIESHPGMSKRDYFAGQALVGAMVNATDGQGQVHFGVLAKDCYAAADAMVKAGSDND